MRKSHKRRPDKPLVIEFRANQRIRSAEVRLIDENGQMVGTVSIGDALRRAEDVGLDLVEVSPKAVPPVCKIMNFGSFKYQKEKEAKAQKQKQKIGELKGIRLSLRIGDHDKEIRLAQAKEFLAEQNKVRVELTLKGRERQHIEQARQIMNEFVKNLGDSAKVEQPFTRQAGKLSIVVAPAK